MVNVRPIDVGITGDRPTPTLIRRIENPVVAPITRPVGVSPPTSPVYLPVGNIGGATGDSSGGSPRSTLPVAEQAPVESGVDSTVGNNPSSGTDPVLAGILGAINGNAAGDTTYPAGAGTIPSGLIGTGTVASGSGSSSAVVILVLVAAAVLGYFLWEKYKGKLKKHEEGQQ